MWLAGYSERLPLVSELRNAICWRSECRRRKSIFLLTKYQLRTEIHNGISMNLHLHLRLLHTNPVSLDIAILSRALSPNFAHTRSLLNTPPTPWVSRRP